MTFSHAPRLNVCCALLSTLLALVACGGDTAGSEPASPAPPAPGAPKPGAPTPGVPGTAPAPSPGGPNAAVPGALSAPSPTINHISLEWALAGDANRNAVVAVRYRVQGSSLWRQALPLRRVPAGSNEGFSWSERFSGSVFDVLADTAYEVELQLNDPDGGGTTRVLEARTRPVPAPLAGAPIRPATPTTLAGTLDGAQPGDIVELAPGNYAAFTVGRSGAAGRPLVIRGRPGAVVNGEISVFNQAHVHLTGLTVNGRIRFNGSSHMAITRNTVNATAATAGDGIVSFLRAENAYIADNVVNGLTVWAEASLGVNGNNRGEGILVTGPGHVIEHNRVRGMRDGISFLEDDEAVDQYSIDVLRNDISESGDDGIEADFCRHNCRIVGNRLTNSFIALSSQPSLGGPTYFVRNVVYNAVHLAFKLYRGSVGDVLLHNTVVKNGDAFADYAGRPIAQLFSRNNLFLGGPGGRYNGFDSGSGRVIQAPALVNTSTDADFDAFGSSTGFAGRLGDVSFDSLASLRALTTQKNAVQAGLNVFAVPLAFPALPLTLYSAPDLRPLASAAVVDAATLLPNVNDGFAGRAPDMGAHEAGAALPVYGPR